MQASSPNATMTFDKDDDINATRGTAKIKQGSKFGRMGDLKELEKMSGPDRDNSGDLVM